MHAPTAEDFTNLKRILWYLKWTVTMDVFFDKYTDFTLTAYSNIDCEVVQTKDVILEVFALIWVRTSSLGHPRNTQLFQKVPPRLSIPHSLKPLQNWFGKELGISIPVTIQLFRNNHSSVYLTANPNFHREPSVLKHIFTMFVRVWNWVLL